MVGTEYIFRPKGLLMMFIVMSVSITVTVYRMIVIFHYPESILFLVSYYHLFSGNLCRWSNIYICFFESFLFTNPLRKLSIFINNNFHLHGIMRCTTNLIT